MEFQDYYEEEYDYGDEQINSDIQMSSNISSSVPNNDFLQQAGRNIRTNL